MSDHPYTPHPGEHPDTRHGSARDPEREVRELAEEIADAIYDVHKPDPWERQELIDSYASRLRAFLAEREEEGENATEGIGWPAAMDAPISPQNVDGVGRTLAEWQDEIHNYATGRSGAPEHLIDGSGTDSGDPLDLTLAEVGQAIAWVEERAEKAEDQLRRALREGERLREILGAVKEAADDCFEDRGYSPGEHYTVSVCLFCGSDAQHDPGCVYPDLEKALASPAAASKPAQPPPPGPDTLGEEGNH